ncbi:hypothetical protein GA0116948_11855 [Chitinophaga costaii]|uniref:Uncharacterized protein n=1 Tax=Chitinophaga costaii TaxID=1335309 RepID=A0A1C4FYV6_9BACT|nr:hypothetical protein GA0116948_11855 [Chitinophaga costaii]
MSYTNMSTFSQKYQGIWPGALTGIRLMNDIGHRPEPTLLVILFILKKTGYYAIR